MIRLLILIVFAIIHYSISSAHVPATSTTDTVRVDNSAPKFFFEEGLNHDFGTIKEGSEPSYIFMFKNVGKQPLIINHVVYDGGARVDYSRAPVLPGKTGEIRAGFHTYGQAGQRFEKSLTVMSNAVPYLVLSINGYIAKDVPDTLSAARFRFYGGETHDFGIIKEGPEAIYVFKFKNVGKQPLIITNVTTSSGSVVANWSKEPVLPGKSGEIQVRYHTSGRIGHFYKSVWITSNAVSGRATYELQIKGIVVRKDDSTAVSSNITSDKAPRFLFLDGEKHDFGTVVAGPELVHIFRFKNIGQQPLIIYGVTTKGSHHVAESSDTPVQPGQMGEIKVRLYTNRRFISNFEWPVNIFSNASPDYSRYKIYVKGTIVENASDK